MTTKSEQVSGDRYGDNVSRLLPSGLPVAVALHV